MNLYSGPFDGIESDENTPPPQQQGLSPDKARQDLLSGQGDGPEAKGEIQMKLREAITDAILEIIFMAEMVATAIVVTLGWGVR